QLQLSAQVLPLELLVLAHVGRDHLADLARFQQLAEAEAVDAGVVGNYRQLFCARVPQGGDQCLRDAAQAEAADGKRLAISHDVAKRSGRICKLLAPAWLRAGRRHPPRPVAEDAHILTIPAREPIGPRSEEHTS